jgi:beta-phosphoglucomutase
MAIGSAAIPFNINFVLEDCLVFEDTPKGAETALNAGMKCVILTTTHQADEFSYLDNIIHFAPDYKGDFFKHLLNR